MSPARSHAPAILARELMFSAKIITKTLTHTRHTHSTTNDNGLVAVVRVVVVAHKVVVGGFADGGFAERRPIGRRGVASPDPRIILRKQQEILAGKSLSYFSVKLWPAHTCL